MLEFYDPPNAEETRVDSSSAINLSQKSQPSTLVELQCWRAVSYVFIFKTRYLQILWDIQESCKKKLRYVVAIDVNRYYSISIPLK